MAAKTILAVRTAGCMPIILHSTSWPLSVDVEFYQSYETVYIKYY
jgi:hypothetical protein